jgi:hypothetical protein
VWFAVASHRRRLVLFGMPLPTLLQLLGYLVVTGHNCSHGSRSLPGTLCCAAMGCVWSAGDCLCMHMYVFRIPTILVP